MPKVWPKVGSRVLSSETTGLDSMLIQTPVYRLRLPYGPPDYGIFREEDYMSLDHEYACRTRMCDDAGRPYGWTGKVQRKMWNIL
jgi:hypothetical protein